MMEWRLQMFTKEIQGWRADLHNWKVNRLKNVKKTVYSNEEAMKGGIMLEESINIIDIFWPETFIFSATM